jgi:hypothetical protein
MAHTTAMPNLRIANGEWELAGTIEKKRNSADDFRLLGELDSSFWAASAAQWKRKKIAFLRQALKIDGGNLQRHGSAIQVDLASEIRRA